MRHGLRELPGHAGWRCHRMLPRRSGEAHTLAERTAPDRNMAGRAPSQRQLRVGELIRHELAGIFARGETGDPALDGMGVTVLEVAVSPDLRIATAYVRPFAKGTGDTLLKALDRSRKYLRGLVSPRLQLRFVPELRFRLDTALDYAAHVDDLLKNPAVRRDLEKDSED